MSEDLLKSLADWAAQLRTLGGGTGETLLRQAIFEINTLRRQRDDATSNARRFRLEAENALRDLELETLRLNFLEDTAHQSKFADGCWNIIFYNWNPLDTMREAIDKARRK